MDIINIVNSMQPRTISKFALKASDFPNGESSVPFMGGFVQLFPNAVLPDPAAVTSYVMPPPLSPIPDLATQLANLLIAKGTLAKTDINSTTLAQLNATLTATGQTAIK